MKVIRENNIATMVMETDSDISDKLIEEIKKIEELIYIKGINPIKG